MPTETTPNDLHLENPLENIEHQKGTHCIVCWLINRLGWVFTSEFGDCRLA
jgi:hypothetical protein